MPVCMALIDYDSVEFANANRARIVATINSNTSSSWTAAIPVRFANTPYKVFRSLAAGVLNGNPRENDAGLPVKTLDDLVQRRASLALAAGASISAPAIPDEFDSASNWPMCPILLEIRDQSACGSCYAVSAASTATDRFCIYHNGARTAIPPTRSPFFFPETSRPAPPQTAPRCTRTRRRVRCNMLQRIYLP